jgi:hypothetical protein
MTWADLERLAVHDILVSAMVEQVRQGRDREAVLLDAVAFLLQQLRRNERDTTLVAAHCTCGAATDQLVKSLQALLRGSG